MTPLEKCLLSLTALVASARKGLETHTEEYMADWLHEKLEDEADDLLHELYDGEYSGTKR